MIDWKDVIVAVIVAIPPTIVSTAALIKVIRTHDAVNSKMQQLLELTKKAAYAKGRKDQKDSVDEIGQDDLT